MTADENDLKCMVCNPEPRTEDDYAWICKTCRPVLAEELAVLRAKIILGKMDLDSGDGRYFKVLSLLRIVGCF